MRQDLWFQEQLKTRQRMSAAFSVRVTSSLEHFYTATIYKRF